MCAPAALPRRRGRAQVWSRLPAGCQAAWEALLARRAEGEAGEPLSAAELRQLLDSCAEAGEVAVACVLVPCRLFATHGVAVDAAGFLA